MASAPPQGWTDRMNFRKAIPPQGGGLTPSFWLPFADLGNGVVETTEYRTNATPTFTRATTAWTRLSTLLWAEIASGSPRSYYNASGVYCGFLAEPSRTNRCLHSRDLTNVAWVAVNVTPAKTQVGLDGVANSCSLLTSTGAGGTLLQTVVSASATRAYSAWIKRSVGTGTLEMTVDGVTWVDVTSQVGASSLALCQISQAAVTNPIMGFRIGSSGDAFIIDMCQEETGLFAGTPYPATTVAVTRNADALSYVIGTWFNANEGSVSIEPTPWVASDLNITSYIKFHDGDNTDRIGLHVNSTGSFRYFVAVGNVTQCDISTANLYTAGVTAKVSACYKLNDFRAVMNNGTAVTDASGTVPTTVNSLQFAGTLTAAFAAVKNAKYFNRRLSNSQLQALTA